jgi:hypothetical protein
MHFDIVYSGDFTPIFKDIPEMTKLWLGQQSNIENWVVRQGEGRTFIMATQYLVMGRS